MSKRKIKTQRQLLLEKNLYTIQDFEQPQGIDKRFVRISHYMLHHINYKNLSPNAKVLLQYMKDWAFASEEFITHHTFDFSTTLATKNKIMSRQTTIKSLKELEYYGFIKKENNACQTSGMTQKWSFNDEWYRSEKKLFKKQRK